jgi:hypothetical protein
MTDVIPVRRGDRDIGALVIGPERTKFVPAVDATWIATAALAAVVAVAAAAAVRRRPAIGAVSMGPGGWVSVKGTAPGLRDGAARPWWAKLLRAHRLVVRD